MSLSDQFAKAVAEQKRKTESKNPLIAGTLGITMGGQTIVEVPDRPSYVYVQVRSSQAEVIQAFNQTVSPVYGLPVFIQWQGNRYVVTERDTMRYSNWIDSSAYLPRHASTHEARGSAGDVVFVAQEQFLPLLPTPSGSLGNGSMIVNDYNLQGTGGNFTYFPAQATVNMTVWNPSTPTGAIMALVTLDASNGQLKYFVNSGNVFGNWLTGTADVLPKIFSNPDLGRYLPIAAVRLVSGTQVITWDNIYDVRPLFGVTRGLGFAPAGGGGGSSSGLAILNNGLLVTYASQLNLLGTQFTITSSGTEADLTILGGGGGGGTGFLSLDTSNGPLFGPLVVYQKNPNTVNQYFDFSTIVGYLSGTNFNHGGAAIEAVVWSTGTQHYGILIDDQAAGGPSLQISDQGRMNKTTFEIDHNWDFLRKGGTDQFNPRVHWTRGGGGNPHVTYLGEFLLIDENDTYVHAPSIRIQGQSTPVTDIWPMHTGSPWSQWYPFPIHAGPYQWDTFWFMNASGIVHSYWNRLGEAEMWFTPDGRLAMNQLMIREAKVNGSIHSGTSFSMGEIPLVAGTATVTCGPISMSSRVFLTVQNGSGGHVGVPYVYSRMPGSGFTILSTDLQDVSRVAWIVVQAV